jgi:hypothetical protein
MYTVVARLITVLFLLLQHNRMNRLKIASTFYVSLTTFNTTHTVRHLRILSKIYNHEFLLFIEWEVSSIF